MPERVRALEAEKDELIARSRERTREIDAAIDAELDYYAPFSVLPNSAMGLCEALSLASWRNSATRPLILTSTRTKGAKRL